MARKNPPKPIAGLKHDFYESLDHLLQQILMLHQQVDIVIKRDLIANKDVAAMVRERNEAVRKAMFSDE